jgi:hypothetical protein
MIEDFSGGNFAEVKQIVSSTIVLQLVEIIKSIIEIFDRMFPTNENRDHYIYEHNN